jgi:hypothetical protein
MNGIVDRADQEAGPVALEERLVVPIATTHGPSRASESLTVQANAYLFGAAFWSLGSKPEVLKRTCASHRRAIPVWSAKGPGAAAATAMLDKERERREDGFGEKRRLPPLEGAQGAGGPVVRDALLPDRLIQRPSGIESRTHVDRVANYAGMVAHTGLNVLSDRAHGQNAIDLQDIDNAFHGFVDRSEVRANPRSGRTPRGDVLGAACGE